MYPITQPPPQKIYTMNVYSSDRQVLADLPNDLPRKIGKDPSHCIVSIIHIIYN